MARYTAITSKLGVYVDTISADTQEGAEQAARAALASGAADSAAVYEATPGVGYGNRAVSYFGTGR